MTESTKANIFMKQEQQLQYQLALWRIPGIGPRAFKFLREKVEELSFLFKASSSQLQQLEIPQQLISALKHVSWKEVELDLNWQNQKPHRFILTLEHQAYPAQLKEISAAPPILFVEGDLSRLSEKQIAMVGSRNASFHGLQIAKQFAFSLAEHGVTITSGLAYGIDKASHEGALTTKAGTIAVLGTGLDNIYPKSHQRLADEIIENGALVSEFPIGSLPKAHHFPRRNRLISGLTLGVVVVEAALQSGSLITARYALEQNREVFAIPGPIHNPLAKGCHQLIRQGATLVETVEDILTELGALKTLPSKESSILPSFPENPADNEQKVLLQCLGSLPTPIDILIERSKLAADIVATNLLLLEVEGYVQKTPAGYVRT